MIPNGLFNQKPRVLIVDSDPKTRISYQVWLMQWGYEPVLAMGNGDSLIRNAKARAREKCCSLALIDLRLFDAYDEHDNSGLQLADELGDPVRSIILVGSGNQNALRKILEKYEFIYKGDTPETIKQTLDSEAKKINAFKRELRFDNIEILEEIVQSPLGVLTGEYPDQIADVIARLFPNAKKLRLEKLDPHPLSTNISTVPRPNSIVLKVYEEDFEPYVVKLARAEKVQKEVYCYNQYISRRLTGSFTARLERNALHWVIGGASYSYVGDFDVKTFSRYYKERPIEDIEESLKNFFGVVWGRHYMRGHEEHDVSLFSLYSKVWGEWYEKRVKLFSPTSPINWNIVYRELAVPEPVGWFRKRIAENPDDLSRVNNTRVAITHGDLHGDNLLIDSKKLAWVIDFERCGEGHILQDFIELEADIFNRLEADNNNLSAYFKMCLVVLKQKKIGALEKSEIASEDNSFKKALETISILRSLAHQSTEIGDAREYLLGLLFNTIFRATIVQERRPQKSQSRALLLASIMCHRLDHWDEPWPPPEWENLFKSKGA
jgi:hypothetical protein